MTGRQVVVAAPSRLHFGLLRFGQTEGRSYGGVGMMIREPRVTVRVRPAAQWDVVGPGAQRAEAVARRVVASTSELEGKRFAITIEALPPLHAGLGVGTQLALATAAGITAASGSAEPAEATKPQAAGRAKRSAVGSYGFARGGLIYEAGYLPAEPIGKLVSRVAMPAAWHIVLVRLPTPPGVSGAAESEAFAQLPPVPADVTRELERLAAEEMMPGAQQADLARFSEAVYRYGMLAGQCFASIQGGPFATPAIAEAVGRLRELGVQGAGQSSWGPTIYAFCETEDDARQLLDRFATDSLFCHAQWTITTPDNEGATMVPADG